MRKRKGDVKSICFFICLTFGITGIVSAQKTETDLVYKIKKATVESARPPVLFLLHGFGSNEEDLFDLSATMDGRFTVVSLRAPLALDNGGFAWYHLERTPDNKLKYDYSEAKLTREKLWSFIQKMCREFKLDSTAVYLLGFSQGAILSYDIALSKPGKIRGVLALSGRLMDQSKEQTNKWTLLKATAFFIAHGNFDERIPPIEAETARDFLKQKGMEEIEFHTYNMQHVLNGQELNDIRAWLKKQLNKPVTGSVKKPASSTKK